MNWKFPSKIQGPRRVLRWEKTKAAFTLVELLAVVAIMVLMMAFLGPAVSSIKGGRDIVSNAYGISGALEQARTYAMANNTYAWVGFFEEDGANPTLTGTVAATSGTGRVVVGSFASRDGTRYSATTSGTTVTTGTVLTSATNLVAVGKVEKFENTHINSSDVGGLGPAVGNPLYQVETMVSPGPKVGYPLGATKPTYVFSKIIEFNPMGEASRVGDSLTLAPTPRIGIGLQPARGNIIDPKFVGKNAASIIIDGLSGRVQVFKQ